MSPSKMRKTNAYRDGTCHADGGTDLRSNYCGDMLVAYDLGYREHTDYLEHRRATADDDHVVELLSQELDASPDTVRKALENLASITRSWC